MNEVIFFFYVKNKFNENYMLIVTQRLNVNHNDDKRDIFDR